MNNIDYFVVFGQLYRELTHIRRFKAALARPRAVQEKKLLDILRLNAESEFGRKHGFHRLKSIKDYQDEVPACTYENLEPYIEASMCGAPAQLSCEKPVMFATTSGTTGKPKFIPITETHLADYTHAFHIHNWGLTRDNPQAAHLPGSKYLIFNSNDLDGYTKDGTPYGSVSGLLRRRQSPLVQRYFALPPAVSRIKNVESKYYSILRLALPQKVVCMASCNPSTLLILAEKLQEHADELLRDIFDGGINSNFSPPPPLAAELAGCLAADRDCARRLAAILEKSGQLRPADAWPDLSVLSVWKGGPMQFYLDRLPEKYGKVKIRDFGYMASEGRGTIPLADEGAGGIAALTSHFFEFVPAEDESPDRRRFLTLDQLEAGRRYYIHFTTAAGLYRYNINDLMEVVGFESATPVLQFVRKGNGISSITGEKLSEEQVTSALQEALSGEHRAQIEHFVMAVQLADLPYYTGFVESSEPLSEERLAALAGDIDASLQAQNLEYRDKRQSMRLGAVKLQLLKAGTFMKLRQQRVLQGAPEAQVKIPFLTNSISFCRDIATLSDAELSTELMMQS
jgi:hypothetical protein